ncbi:MAG: RluA family pseudouridine synthase [Myxococcota bacterium]
MDQDLVDIPFEVRRWERNQRVDVFLSKRISRMSRSLAARLVKTGRVRKEPGAFGLRPSMKVAEGDVVIVKRKPLVEGPVDAIEIPSIHEDARVLAVNKPGDLVVHPTASAYHRTLIRILRNRRNEPALDLAHRIDKETSGLLLLARDFEAASDLKTQFAQRRVEKAYLAVVKGRVARDEFVIDLPLRLADTVTKVMMEPHPGGGPALTFVRVLARGPDASLVEARPKTGRQHQIRVHLQQLGHPILGDKLYLGGEDFFIDALRGVYEHDELVTLVGHHRQALHAHAATFFHPESGSPMTLSAPLTPDLIALCARQAIVAPDGRRAA